MKKPFKPVESTPAQSTDLRRQAEETLRQQNRDWGSVAPEDSRNMLHELEVHQIELEMQNEELRRAQLELEASRASYFDLFYPAPVGYCTISEQDLLLEANLTAATLLGTTRGELTRQRKFSTLMHKNDQDS